MRVRYGDHFEWATSCPTRTAGGFSNMKFEADHAWFWSQITILMLLTAVDRHVQHFAVGGGGRPKLCKDETVRECLQEIVWEVFRGVI